MHELCKLTRVIQAWNNVLMIRGTRVAHVQAFLTRLASDICRCSSAAGGVLPRRVLATTDIRVLVLAVAQVPLDLALVDVDQVVVVLPFPDDPDTPEKERGSVTLTGQIKETAQLLLDMAIANWQHRKQWKRLVSG